MSNAREYTYRTHEILQVTPTTAFEAVYAVEKEDGKCRLVTARVDAIAVARETISHVTWDGAANTEPTSVERDDPAEVVVPLILEEGFWHICPEDSNYAGMMRKGEDRTKAIGCLAWEYRDRLEP